MLGAKVLGVVGTAGGSSLGGSSLGSCGSGKREEILSAGKTRHTHNEI
jgi:hypothetical protein